MASTLRTSAEIDNEVATLRKMKPKVRRRTGFGDDNHAAIEAQIEVLEKRMTEDQIWDRWPEATEEEDMGEDGENERTNAQDALYWMIGENDDAPSKDWADLVSG